MEFQQMDINNVSLYKKEITKFFDDNIDDYYYFYPHKLTYTDFVKELKTHPLDVYIFLIDTKIYSYGILRGWQEGYDIPSLGIMTDINERGKGYSNLMMKYLHEIAKIKGSQKVRLTVLKENTKAISLYNKLGYVFTEKDDKNLLGIKNL
jgi:ribosomal protein S18 acetylase RimI-like enzyme